MSQTVINDPLDNSVKEWALLTKLKLLTGLLERPYSIQIVMGIVLLMAALFRFHGLNWDEGRHLHPDERFLSTVTNNLEWPDTFENYFDPNVSTLSPYSLPGMGFYVYGTFPVYIVKWTAIFLDRNNYDQITMLGRVFSGLFDIGAIFILYLLGKKLYGKKVGLLSAGLLSLSVLDIQLSHFYTVDTFSNLFIIATIYFVLRANSTGRWFDHVLMGLLFGLGLASKISVLTLAVPILAGAGLNLYQRRREGEMWPALEHTLVRLVTVFFVAILTFRVIQPMAFSGPGFWDWSLNPRWLADIDEQRKTLSGSADLVWVQQWTGRSALFPLSNLVIWGLGIPLGLAGFAGLALAAYELIRYRKLEHLVPVSYVAVTFLYHSATFVKFMRYFLPIYPFLALYAGYFIIWLWRRAVASEKYSEEGLGPEPRSGRFERILGAIHFNRQFTLVVGMLVIIGSLLYAISFSAIYGQENTRIKASRWMYENIPAGSTLANEHWDDWLPIGGLDGKTSYGDNGTFLSVEMKNYENDTPDKLLQMVENLTQADYIVLSSNRLYDSIPRLPMRYPLTTRYYELLFDGELGFERVAEFTSYPTFVGIQIPDQSAEESFSVYDHPRVQIFKKTAAFDPAEIEKRLSNGIAWESVLQLTPRQASAAPQSLQLSADERLLYEKSAVWSSSEVSGKSWGSRFPVRAWFIVLEVIGLLTLPLTWMTFKNLSDRGYIFSKALGMLMISWGTWMIASARLAAFTWWTILAVMALLALVTSLVISNEKWNDLKTFVRERWRLLLFEEVLFWIFFALLLFIRFRNPDLWHPGLGGEKPMDLAYLTAIVRTPYFPSYDPWFAGGYINYYYFGFVLVSSLVHLTGLMPYIAYNLAVPTFFAMTAMGGFVVAFNFAEGWRNKGQDESWQWPGRWALVAGVCGALFVAVMGNLGQVQLLWDGVRNLSGISADSDPSVGVILAQFGEGLRQLLDGNKLQFRTEWWYWNATRIIPAGAGEAGPINEMPFFTFLYGDLHAHMMGLPYTLLVLGLALNILRTSKNANPDADSPVWWRDPTEMLTLALLALTTGALWPINTWDFPTYTVLTAAALACREYARRGRVDASGVWSVMWRFALILILGRLLFLPFHQNYAGDYFGAGLWNGSRTPLWAYLLIHGFFLFVLSSYLIHEFLNGHGHNALVRSLRLNIKHLRRRARLQRLFKILVSPDPAFRWAVNTGKWMFVLAILILLIRPVIGLPLALTLYTTLLLFSDRPNPSRQFVLCMIGLGLVFTIMVEIIVLKGDIGRMNTVFKFYLQVWILWAVAASAVLPLLAGRMKLQPRPVRLVIPEPEEGTAWTPEVEADFEALRPRSGGKWGRRWWWAFGVLAAACLLYPLTAAPVRIRDRFENSTSATLDGSAYMRTSVYNDQGEAIELDWDRQAIDWLRANVHGIPAIVEANTPLYRWGARVSIYTGLPTVIGWDWHQKQQRSVLPGPMIDQRIQDVQTIYTGSDLKETMRLLDQYDVQYIYVGALERIYYAGDGLNKFDQPSDLWNLVYENEQVKIFQVH